MFLIDKDILVDSGFQLVAVDLERAMVLVEANIEERLAVVGPNGAAIGIGNGVGKVVARLKVADSDRVVLRPIVVAGVG